MDLGLPLILKPCLVLRRLEKPKGFLGSLQFASSQQSLERPAIKVAEDVCLLRTDTALSTAELDPQFLDIARIESLRAVDRAVALAALRSRQICLAVVIGRPEHRTLSAWYSYWGESGWYPMRCLRRYFRAAFMEVRATIVPLAVSKGGIPLQIPIDKLLIF